MKTLDRHAFTLQSAQLTRTRNYDDSFVLPVRYPNNAPEWTFIAQETPGDTDFSPPNTPAIDDVESEGNEEE